MFFNRTKYTINVIVRLDHKYGEKNQSDNFHKQTKCNLNINCMPQYCTPGGVINID